LLVVVENYKVIRMKRKKKGVYFRHGGLTTPLYFCPVCGHAHTEHSKIGKKHKEYARKI